MADDIQTSEQTKRNKERISAIAEKVLNSPPVPKVSIVCGKVDKHPGISDLAYISGLFECFSSNDNQIINTLLNQVVSFTGKSDLEAPPNEEVINTALSFMHSIRPQDVIEAMLAVQMLATHKLSVTCMEQLYRKDGLTTERLNAYMNASTKLSRTYLAQMEALNRHRGKGQQKMTVEHVHVNEGGQAIIGNVNTKSKARGGGSSKKL